jgi:hypothetical protein
VVGISSGTTWTSAHGFIDSDGIMRNLNDLIPSNSGWTITNAVAINNLGQILAWGAGSATGGNSGEILLTPVNLAAPGDPNSPSAIITPEPSSLALYGLMAVGLTVRCWARRRSQFDRRQDPESDVLNHCPSRPA